MAGQYDSGGRPQTHNGSQARAQSDTRQCAWTFSTFGLLGKHSPELSVHAPYVGVLSGPIGLETSPRPGTNGPGQGSFT